MIPISRYMFALVPLHYSSLLLSVRVSLCYFSVSIGSPVFLQSLIINTIIHEYLHGVENFDLYLMLNVVIIVIAQLGICLVLFLLTSICIYGIRRAT